MPGKDDKKGDKGKANDKTGGAAPAAPLEPLPENAVVVDHTRLKYFIDIHNESSIACKSIQIHFFVNFQILEMQNLN